jgi:hypothetical protein
MSWLFSQALVEEYLGENSLDGEPSVQSNGKPTPQAYCAPDKMTEFSRLSRFGMTYKPLTDIPGEELSMSSVVAFHVKTLVPQEKAQELMENEAECGEKWHASFVKFDLDTRSWKTHQCSLLEDLEEFLETWPQWGLMRDGECWEQQTLEQTIRGTEFGLSEQTWPTPRCQMTRPVKIRLDIEKGHKGNLEEVVALREKFTTPTAHNSKETNAPSEMNRNTPTLAAQAGGKLNPTWVEWLMGWPLGWTDLQPLATDKSHCAQQQHGEF